MTKLILALLTSVNAFGMPLAFDYACIGFDGVPIPTGSDLATQCCDTTSHKLKYNADDTKCSSGFTSIVPTVIQNTYDINGLAKKLIKTPCVGSQCTDPTNHDQPPIKIVQDTDPTQKDVVKDVNLSEHSALTADRSAGFNPGNGIYGSGNGSGDGSANGLGGTNGLGSGSGLNGSGLGSGSGSGLAGNGKGGSGMGLETAASTMGAGAGGAGGGKDAAGANGKGKDGTGADGNALMAGGGYGKGGSGGGANGAGGGKDGANPFGSLFASLGGGGAKDTGNGVNGEMKFDGDGNPLGANGANGAGSGNDFSGSREDAPDYLKRIDVSASIFKIVSKRYTKEISKKHVVALD